jgi:hypothetical protein
MHTIRQLRRDGEDLIPICRVAHRERPTIDFVAWGRRRSESSKNEICGGLDRVVFPYAYHAPTGIEQRLFVSAVSYDIALELLAPPLSVCLRQDAVFGA